MHDDSHRTGCDHPGRCHYQLASAFMIDVLGALLLFAVVLVLVKVIKTWM
jgi:hypothetical protein